MSTDDLGSEILAAYTADKRLRDAAPDLLAAVEGMLVYFSHKAGSKFQHEAVAKARAAITKAHGQ